MENLIEIEIKEIDRIYEYLSEMVFRNFYLKRITLKEIKMHLLLWQTTIDLMPLFCDENKLTIEVNAKIYQVILDNTIFHNRINFEKK